MKYTKITTWILAIAMFMFGILKFFNPFKGWYTAQIHYSGLGQFSYTMGIMAEISVGVTLLVCLIYKDKITRNRLNGMLALSYLLIIGIMATGIYVHLDPNVPADVLPLKIKPPYIPMVFLLMALYNLVSYLRHLNTPTSLGK